eukprot:TRINITY_DN733_c0_g1_i3.p1 TRINITY_DN733_c0_g1~~TRINITY_DN733_c0_g1_i3.p1  ORF type:complete len:245 (-),score=65.97 TRINITY_DN733_c0_g1_i3:715-1398(-)
MNEAEAAPTGDAFTTAPSLLVKQRRKGWLIELCLGCEIENEYKIFNPSGADPGSQIMVAREQSSCLWRQCCGSRRQFSMRIETLEGREICHYLRPFRCGYPCCDPCRYAIDCFMPDNKYVGSAKQVCSFCVPVFELVDDNGHERYRVIGNCCGFCNYTLHVHAPDGSIVGRIMKKWSGATKEFFTDADNFVVEFPKTATVADRVVLVGALFLIDFLFFERTGNGAAN